MALLFKFDRDGKLVDEIPYQVREFRDLIRERGESFFRYVALTTDYESPFWELPLDRKKMMAAKECFGKDVIPPKDDKLIEDAALIYQQCQYDHVEEQLQSQVNKHYEYTKILNTIEVMESDKTLDKSVVGTIQTVTALQKGSESEIDRLKLKVKSRREDNTRSRGEKRDSWLANYLTKDLAGQIN